MNSILINKVKKTNRKKVLNKVVDLAEKHQIPKSHPIVVCCISTLFGNNYSRNLLKFKESNYNPYNARSDLLVISRFHLIKAKTKRVKLNINIIYLTLDKNLLNFLSMLKIKRAFLHSDAIEYDITYKTKSLFPEASDDDLLEIKSLLNKYITK